MKRTRYSDDTVRLAKLMHEGGLSGPAIARELSVPYPTLAAWLNGHARQNVTLTLETRNGEDHP